MQYSVSGGSYTDIDGKTITVTPDSRKVLTAYFDKTDLPDFAYMQGQQTVSLRLVPVDMTTVDGGSALDSPSSGELAINDVVVQGRKLSYDDVVMGDTDGDEDISIIDATVLQRYLAGVMPLTSAQLTAADVIRGGEPDIICVTIIQRALAGIVNPYLNLNDR